MERDARIVESELPGGGRLFSARTGVRGRIAFSGSMRGGWTGVPGGRDAAWVAGSLLDAGTSARTKDALREALGDRGARLSFGIGADRTWFSGSCFPEDLAFVLKLAAECLVDSAFPTKEVARAKARIAGELDEMKTDTRYLAQAALDQHLYPAGHPNASEPLAARVRSVAAVSRKDLLPFPRRYGRDGLVVAVAGDVDAPAAARTVRTAFSILPEGGADAPAPRVHAASAPSREFLLLVQDKANVDVRLGTAVPFDYDSPEYLPLRMLASLLGGSGLSTGHLMRTIRERDGYTYGIYAGLGGFLERTQGNFTVSATFSPGNWREALDATRREIGVFIDTGLTPEALATKKDEMAGRYLIGLATSRGLANELLGIGEKGWPLEYLWKYPDLVRAVPLETLKDLAPLIATDRLSVAASGSFPKA